MACCYLSCMSLCIIMLELHFIRCIFFAISVLLGFLLLASPQFILNASHHCCVDLGKNHIRMTRGGCSSNIHEGSPIRRSARQAGHSPEPYVPPPPPPPNPPSTEQILRMFEERRNNDLIEILRSVQAVVGQNGNQNGHHSKLSDFQRTKPPSFSKVIDPLDADDWL